MTLVCASFNNLFFKGFKTNVVAIFLLVDFIVIDSGLSVYIYIISVLKL